VDVFDGETGEWANHDPALDQIAHVVVSEEHAILVGIAAGAPTATVYDTGSGVWVTSPITSPHFGGAATTINNHVVLAGGSLGPDPGCTNTDAVDMYDVSNGQWTAARLSEGRASGLATIELGGSLIFAGGLTCAGVSNHVDMYNSATDKWSSAMLSEARTAITAVGAGSLAVFAGGLRPHDTWVYGEATDAVDVYDADTDRWTAGHLAEPRVLIAPAIFGSEVLLAGGERPATADRQPYVASAMVDVFDTTMHAWTTDNLSAGRAGALVANLGPRVAFVIGHVDCAGCGIRTRAVIDVFGDSN
jgi:hypothetical protein